MDETSQPPKQHGKLHRLFDENFLEYTSYVIKERAIPDINDGLKPVQRRILQTLFNMDDGRFQKVANVVGETMKLHPHGDASIFGALVNLANKGYLIERQGNFGNIFTGDQASAPRYIECRLTPMAKETLFNRELTQMVDSYDGRMKEPVTLPAKIPLLILEGAEGIAVGMATKIMPHNFCEILRAQKNILRNKPFTLYPDFPQGGLLDVSHYNDGNGRIKCRARIEEKNEKTIIIKEIPYGTTTQSLSDSIEKAAKSGKIKIQSINDYTAEEVEIEIKLARGVYASDTIKALYAFSDCEVPITPNLTLIRDNRPENISISEVLRYNTEKLTQDLEAELNIELLHLVDKLHAKTLEQIFIEERLYKLIEECKSYNEVCDIVAKALEPFAKKLKKPITREDVETLLEIRIKRISRYDIERQRKEIKDLQTAMQVVMTSLKDMVSFTINYLDDLLKKYGKDYKRRTEIMTFTEVQARKVAISNLLVGFNMETGLFGHLVKTDCEITIPASEYDRILLIYKDGTYKVIPVPDKIFVGQDLLWAGKVENDIIFNVIYREGTKGQSFVKRFYTPKFILNKEYHLFPKHKKSWIQFLQPGEGVRVRVDYLPQPRAKTNSVRLHMEDYLIKGASAIGKRLSARPVRRITGLLAKMTPDEEAAEAEQFHSPADEPVEITEVSMGPISEEKEETPQEKEKEKDPKTKKAQLSLFEK